MGKILSLLIGPLVVLALMVAAWLGYSTLYTINKKVTYDIQIEPNQGFRSVFVELVPEGQTPLFYYRYLTSVRKFHTKIRYGHYSGTNESLSTVFKRLEKGAQTTYPVTIPEGLNIYDIDKVFSDKNIMPKGAFIHACKNQTLLSEVIKKGYSTKDSGKLISCEGYMYPDTYYFPAQISANKALKVMYANFESKLPNNFRKNAEKVGLTEYEAVTMASIIQKETYIINEMPIVSSVFHNRIAKGMRLQADPTIIYGIYENYDGDIRKKDINDRGNPYNTYTINGLTPTPIANPSKEALQAAVTFNDTPYYFFVATKGGEHTFSITYEEHRQKVRDYIN